ncbi:MAG TPA: D-aminoacylase [Fimbriimonadaceae bacterium]|nr:D-aminoacylase [Fimbriimonadaceae bacterium]
MLALLAAALVAPPSLLIQGGRVVDGSGKAPFAAAIRIVGDQILEVGQLNRKPGETVFSAHGLHIAPGFIDAHSHVDGGIFAQPTAPAATRQGITTAVVGQDGGHPMPLLEWTRRLKSSPVALNLAAFAGHGTIRSRVMKDDYRRPATPSEIKQMKELLEQELKAGALGLSTGLEYDPGLYSELPEIVELARAAAAHGGSYITHVRDEENEALTAFEEAIEVGFQAKVPVQISHIKLASEPVWARAGEVVRMLQRARGKGLRLTADVYPYTFWQSSITVLIPHRNFGDVRAWRTGLEEVGGPRNVTLTTFTPDRSWEGQTLAELSERLSRDPVELVIEIVRRTRDGMGSESVVVQAMVEEDLRTFVRDPNVMFCSDGGLSSKHPRGAGSFPRILAKYVREEAVLTLPEAIRKMTSLPARTFGFRDRGLIRPGMRADLVLFAPDKIRDRATLEQPYLPPVGISHVMVNGRWVVRRGLVTGARPGRFLARMR